MYDLNGEPREHYRELLQVLSGMTKSDQMKIENQGYKKFMGDNKLLSFPRIITEEDYALLAKGTKQRGLAIIKFLKDYFSEGKIFQDTQLKREVFENIIKRNIEEDWYSHLKDRPDLLRFWYGPDIIRDAHGEFRVIEDNPGFIGGVGDLKVATQAILDEPRYRKIFPKEKSTNFYRALINSYKNEIKSDEIILLLEYSPSIGADNESKRTIHHLKEQGVKFFTFDPDDLNAKNKHYKLKINDDAVFLEINHSTHKTRHKVGLVIANIDSFDLDLNFIANRKKRIMIEAEYFIENKRPSATITELKRIYNSEPSDKKYQQLEKIIKKNFNSENYLDLKNATSGLINAILSKKVKSNIIPGIDFIGDKEFYLYVEEFIKYYLNESPILKNIETTKFVNVSGALDSLTMERIFQNKDNYVIKKVDGRGGDAVWVGAKTSVEEFNQLRDVISKNPSVYIAQKYTALSQLKDPLSNKNYIVDLRMISDVTENRILVADRPWGRAIPEDGDGKVNLSQHGLETTVLIKKSNSTLCETILK